METLRNYLETMFAKLPNSPDVLRAKDELWSMMEDKYNELIEEGKNENEAIATVISEFGNLNELSEDLGITGFMENQSASRRNLSLSEVKDYLRDSKSNAFRIALGVLLCILSPVPTILLSGNDFPETFGILALLILAAIAVGIFVSSNFMMNKWDFLTKEPCMIDVTTAQYVHNEKQNYHSTYTICITIGVILCIISVFPIILLDELYAGSEFFENIGAAALLVIVSIAVFLFVIAGTTEDCFTKLLKLNDTHTVGGHFVPSQNEDDVFVNPIINTIMSVFWPTVTCAYLSISFLTFDWHITWVIWPIAGILSAAINSIFDKK